jgi:hypothetical protein
MLWWTGWCTRIRVGAVSPCVPACGASVQVTLVKDATGKSRGYAFLQFEVEADMKDAYRRGDGRKIDGRRCGRCPTSASKQWVCANGHPPATLAARCVDPLMCIAICACSVGLGGWLASPPPSYPRTPCTRAHTLAHTRTCQLPRCLNDEGLRFHAARFVFVTILGCTWVHAAARLIVKDPASGWLWERIMEARVAREGGGGQSTDCGKQSNPERVFRGRVVTDVERGRTVPGWLPRRLGGGIGETRKGGKDVNMVYSGRCVGTVAGSFVSLSLSRGCRRGTRLFGHGMPDNAARVYDARES